MVTKNGKKVIVLRTSNDAFTKLQNAGIKIEYHFPDKFLWCSLVSMDAVYSTNMVPPTGTTITVDQLLQLFMLPCYESRYILYKEFLNEQR